MAENVLVERDGTIATVVLNRPDKLNALNLESWRRLGEVMRELSADDGLRCVVLRGAGERAFAAGADISEFENERKGSAKGKAYGAVVDNALRAISECRHPTIGMIRGNCIGGGMEAAARCDIRVCGASSRFGIPSNRLGLVVGYPEIEILMALVGRGNAMEILLEGRIFGADEAREKGFVNRIVADHEVEEEAMRTARRIAKRAPLSNRWHKKFARRLNDPAPLSEAERDEVFACYDSDDFKAGYTAFLKKSKPEFQGR